MKTKLLSVTFLLCLTGVSYAQKLGEFKPKDTKYGMNKARDAKRIYISNFTVNYQVYNEKEDFKQGGSMFGGGMKGDAKAQLSIGLTGLSETDVQQITDKLYQDYISQIKAKGLEIINVDEAGKSDTYEAYTKMQGGKASLAQFPGMITTSPTGYEWYVKNVDKDGKTKNGGFLNRAEMLFPKLSKSLGDAIIGEVNLYVMFVEDQNAFKGAGANIKVKTNLRLADEEAIIMTSNAKIKLKGQNQTVRISSEVSFYHGKMGLGSTTAYAGSLGKPLEIDDVIEDTKLQSFAKNDADVLGMSNGTYRIFNPDNTESASTKTIKVESKKYIDGVLMAAKHFMDYHVQSFFKDF